MIPHLAEECWSLYNDTNLGEIPWPEPNAKYLEKSSTVVVVQINGKKRGEVNIKSDASEAEVMNELSNIENINKLISGKKIDRTIFVKNKILNILIN